MASPHLYVRSTDGVDTDNGTTWALAKETIAGAAAIDSTTDKRIWVSDNHAESKAAGQTWAFAGTVADPTWVVCVDDTSNPEPPIALATTATCTTTGANSFAITGNVYIYGLTLNAGSGGSAADISFATAAGDVITLEKCNLKLNSASSNSTIDIGSGGTHQNGFVSWKDVGVYFTQAGQRIQVGPGELHWEGGSVLASSTALTTGLIQPFNTSRHTTIKVSGVDLTNAGVASYLVGKVSGAPVDATFIDCKLPAWTTGGLYTGTLQSSDIIRMHNCDSGDTNYRIWVATQFGDVKSDTAIYNDAGADDGSAQGFSWQMVSSANAEFPHHVLESPEIVKWNETTTGTLTATVEIVHNSQGSGTNGALRDDEIWLEVMCMDPGATPVGKWQSDQCANLNLNSNAADQASSSAAWTGDSAGWDTQKLSVSFTPKEKGYVHARVCLAKASCTVYVDPFLTIA